MNRASGARGGLTVRSSLIEDNHDVGVSSVASDITIETSVVRATLPNGENDFGRGIELEADTARGQRGALTLRSSLVEQNHDTGLFVTSSDERTSGRALRAIRSCVTMFNLARNDMSLTRKGLWERRGGGRDGQVATDDLGLLGIALEDVVLS